jgi:hypothetical protein
MPRKTKIYLDKEQFTKLFRNRWQNYGKICEGMNVLCVHIAASMKWRTRGDRLEAAQQATMQCIELIDRFDRNGDNAFSYYTTCARFLLFKIYADQKKHLHVSLDDLLPLTHGDESGREAA